MTATDNHQDWFIYWDDTAGRTLIRCQCGRNCAGLSDWRKHRKEQRDAYEQRTLPGLR
jgi:hypothetical protein